MRRKRRGEAPADEPRSTEDQALSPGFQWPQDEQERIDLIESFGRLIAECEGQVLFRTADGDRLVADSMLSALIGLRNLIEMADRIKLTFEFENPDDEKRVTEFLKKHRLSEQNYG